MRHTNRHVKHVASKSTQPWWHKPCQVVSQEQPDSQTFPFAYTNGVRHYLRGLGVVVTTRVRRKVALNHGTVAA